MNPLWISGMPFSITNGDKLEVRTILWSSIVGDKTPIMSSSFPIANGSIPEVVFLPITVHPIDNVVTIKVNFILFYKFFRGIIWCKYPH